MVLLNEACRLAGGHGVSVSLPVASPLLAGLGSAEPFALCKSFVPVLPPLYLRFALEEIL